VNEPKQINKEAQTMSPVGNVSELRTGRMNTVGVPAEKSKNFAQSAKRLTRLISDESILVILIFLMAVASVALVVSGPRILGHATDIVFQGLLNRDGANGIDFARLHRTLAFAIAVYTASYVLAYGQAFLLAGVVQRTMFKLRQDIESKIHRLPLSYIDRHSRGDLLSRVTNDVDNISQSLQQSLSQLVTSMLTIFGVLLMMFVVSPILALVALTVIPLTLLTMGQIAKRSRAKFISQWRYTGQLNGLVEEAFTGHAIVKVFGRQQEVEERFTTINNELFETANSAQFMSGSIQPATMFIGNLNYVAIAVIGGLRVASGAMSLGDVQAFIQYSRQFTHPMTQAASMMNVLQSGVASAERVFELLDSEEQTTESGVADTALTRSHRV
jgi:ATP-binding cassette, subfamily B, multidrug efflux pump